MTNERRDSLWVIAAQLERDEKYAAARIVREMSAEIDRLTADVSYANEHRDRAHKARVRAAEYAQATRWLRGRVKRLERAIELAKQADTDKALLEALSFAEEIGE